MRPGLASCLAGWLAVVILGCGTEVERVPGLESTLHLRIHTPPTQSAFDGVATLRMTLKMPDGRDVITNVDVLATEFLLEGSPAQGVILLLEGLGVDGQTAISSGQSAPFDLNPTEPVQVDLLFARKGEFARLLGDLGHPRFGHTASALPDGRVLILGGASQGDLDAPADFHPPEIYNLLTQSSCVFEETPCPLFAGADKRYGHTATQTPAGDVLIFGGEDGQGELVEPVLLFDLGADEFTELVNFNREDVVPRAYHAAVGFGDSILIAGGEVDGGTRREPTGNGLLFSVPAETFIRFDLSLNHPRRRHTMTAFGTNPSQVLVVGGEGEAGLVDAAELSDGESFWVVEPAGEGHDGLLRPRVNHKAVAIPPGEVMVLGGDNLLASIDEPEMFFAGSPRGVGFFALQIQATHDKHKPRRGLMAALLPSGGVLYAGGEHLDGFSRELLDTAEVLQVEAGTLNAAFSGVASLSQKLSFPAVATLPGGAMLIAGGLKAAESGPEPSSEVWYYNP